VELDVEIGVLVEERQVEEVVMTMMTNRAGWAKPEA